MCNGITGYYRLIDVPHSVRQTRLLWLIVGRHRFGFGISRISLTEWPPLAINLSSIASGYPQVRTNEVPRCCKEKQNSRRPQPHHSSQRLIGRLGGQTSRLNSNHRQDECFAPVCMLGSIQRQVSVAKHKNQVNQSPHSPPTEPATLLPDMTSSPHFPPAMRIIHVRERASHRLGSFPRS
jgi:hypothetical protein